MKWLVFLFLVRTVFSYSINADENRHIHDPKLFEGDMILTPEQRGNIEMGYDVYHTYRQRASIRQGLWPGGVVIYDIAPDLANNPVAMAAISEGKDEWERKTTCIRFKKRTVEVDYVYFLDGANCSSNAGRIGGRQNIYLGSACWYRGIVAHEIGHAIGFLHEQSRLDRDQYVTILYNNIEPGYENQFQKYGRGIIDSLGTAYDYGSLMHYGDKYFTKNGLPTIVAKQPQYQSVMGQRVGLSAIDAQQANLLYKCVPGVVPRTPPPSAVTTPQPAQT